MLRRRGPSLFVLFAMLFTGGLAMMPMAAALADESEATGAPAGSELDKLLKAEGMKMEDLEANRAGKVTARQVDNIAAHRNTWTTNVFIFTGFIAIGSIIWSIVDYTKKKSGGVFIFPAVMCGLALILYLIYVLFLRLPSSIKDAKVQTLTTRLVDLKTYTTRDGYIVSLDGTTYECYGARLGDDWNGRAVKAYVLPEYKLVMTIEPQ
jgi:hypothetical protein